jgi:hypothetical protein
MITALIDLLGGYYQAGNLRQVEAIAHTMLSAIPDDLVALQFLALALHERGRIRDAYLVLRKAAERQEGTKHARYDSTGEPAAAACYREATRFGSLLAGGWYQISQLMAHYGFKGPAAQALRSSQAAITDRRRVLRMDS